MSRSEFLGWREKYIREPWGIVVDDRRHAELCFRLQNIVNLWAKDQKSLNVVDLFISKTKSDSVEIERMLYAIEVAPWLDVGKTKKEIALEGQANFARMDKLFNGK
jgi:hypothetical protein